MTSTGLGRGRGWAKHDTDSLRKPGTPLDIKLANYTNLVNIINRTTNENLEQQVQEFLKLVDVNNFSYISQKLHEHARKDNELRPKLVMFLNNCTLTQTKDLEERSLSGHFLICMQINYQRRIEIRRKNAAQFYNDIYLLLEYLPYRNFLLFALLDYMEMLLETPSEEEIKIFMDLIIARGKEAYDTKHKKKMNKLMAMTRQVLIDEALSPGSRQMLLYTIDLVNCNFDPLPKHLQEFYKLRLGKDFIPAKSSDKTNSEDNGK
ncbi:PREDICTED: uncharacterized protein LOC107189872 [Dufourea novaeangliae]|uniref:uncharacterized protein LOC107189872 n=1 Tax=Dufourea novaeangliae TaxID=178035 RepID=UPI00076770DE|nr:PREDICTED: uncharacterized protein LOC107189872 [Dufourea novaeangliae]